MTDRYLFVNGSPRVGNTHYLLTQLHEELGGRLVHLKDLKMTPCSSCRRCTNTKMCNKQDDLTEVLEATEHAGILVLGTPNWFNNMSSLMSTYLSRMLYMYEDARLEHKPVAVVMASGSGRSVTRQAAKKAFDGFIYHQGMTDVGYFTFQGVGPQDVKNSQRTPVYLDMLKDVLREIPLDR